MLQKNYSFDSIEDAQVGLITIKQDIDQNQQKNFKDSILHIYAANFDKTSIQQLLDSVKKVLGNIKCVGISEFLHGGGFKETEIKINLIMSRTSSFEVLRIDCQPGNEVIHASKLNKIVKSMKYVRGLELYPAELGLNVTKFLETTVEDVEDIPIFGAMANMTWIKQEDLSIKNWRFAICENVITTGFVAVIYSGKNLQIYADYILGWQPVGRELEVTLGQKSDYGEGCIKAIDGIPAVDVYKKYFGVEWNEYFVWNVCEFPLMVTRNNSTICMVPMAKNDNGELYFSGSIYEGEKICFSYGTVEEVLGSTYEGSERMKNFKPNAVLSYLCGNRVNYLQNDAMKELDYYRTDFSEMTFCHGHFEIYYKNRQGGVLNSSFIAVGLRENDNNEIKSADHVKEKYKYEGIIPLSYRISRFLHVVTKELKYMADEANSANRAKSSFLSNMSHEIRTPINAVLGMDEMILRSTNEQDTYSYATDISTAGRSLLNLVNDILDFSKIEAGKMEIIPVEYSLSSLLNDLVNMIQKRASDKGLKFEVNADKNLPAKLFGDEVRIKQVVTNILTNAVKYTEHGGFTLSVETVSKSSDNIQMKFSVTDTGIGIKSEDIQKLFSAFERIEEKRNRHIEGTGLGMNITQQLLQMMNSKLEVSSVYGEGSTFSFVIDQKVIDWTSINDFRSNHKNLEERKQYHASFQAPSAKILVVDDTPLNLTVIKGLLKQTKIQIDTAENGIECLKKIENHSYDIIFLDHRMPDMDGVEILSRIRTKYKDIPVIAMTANNIIGAREEYISMGFSEYLLKPVDPELLESLTKNFLPAEKLQQSDNVDNAVEVENPTIKKLKSIKNLDITEAIQLIGNESLYLEVLTDFARNINNNSAEIEKYLQNEDVKNYTIKVHALKSSARIIGANELSNLSAYLEKMGDESNIIEIHNKTPELLEKYRLFEENLRFLLQKNRVEPTKEISSAQLTEALESIKEMLLMFDYENAEYILQSLNEYKLSAELQMKLDELSLQISKFDQEKSLNILKNVIGS